ncbi:hypothetical protein Gpo141_00013081 [Globisporangium polare]
MASYEDESSRVSDADAPPLSFASYSSEYYHELDEGEALRKAARAGILLLEKNQELHDENEALRAQLEIFENERPGLKSALTARDDEVAGLAEERRKCLVEINSLRNGLKAKSAMVTDLLDREQRYKGEIEEAEAAKRLAEYQLEILQLEFNELQRKESEKAGDASKTNGLHQYSVTNPAATYDSNQASVFTWADYEELMQKWQATSEENEALQLELKSVRKEVDNVRKKAAKTTEYYLQVEKLEKKNMKLQHANDALSEELSEERLVLESVRTMNLMYKQIAESRPFSVDFSGDTAAQQSGQEVQKLGISVQDVLLETNMKLETELRELRDTVQLYQQYQNQPPDSSHSYISSSSSKNFVHESVVVSELKRRMSRVSSNNSEEYLVSGVTSFSDCNGGDDAPVSMTDSLVRKVQDLQEKLSVAKDMLRHTKLQWSAAVASQKALEECNRSAQEEITRLTQQLDYQMASMATRGSESSTAAHQEQDQNGYDSDEEDKWVEETAPFPAPPGDLNSPLIKCLLDHWTTDKSKIMTLTDWLHHAIRSTGKPTPLRLHSLTSEVAAGFAQLLVPIMREKHGVSVSIYRRDSVHVLSDLVLQTNQPVNVVQSYTTTTAGGPSSTASASASGADAEMHFQGQPERSPVLAQQPPRSRFLKGEAQFLYG